ncbi:MAG: AAA family ATPase [Flavobacteriaceae bacterium]|nr:AAA family ATPase [Flavobacteriaceae bacterium]
MSLSKKDKKRLINKEINDLISPSKNIQEGCLVVNRANTWVDESKIRPLPKMLFDEFWFEYELCILFADTNIGKSVLAVQIADSISRGKSIKGFRFEANKSRVLYLDFELSDKQFEKRCSNNYKDHYKFHDDFFRAEINPDMDVPKEFSGLGDLICNQIESYVTRFGAKVVIIDNLTYLKDDNEKAKDALKLMKKLKEIIKKLKISILVLAHTPKRDQYKPITKNDLAGSKMLMNFCDSSFAIGNSNDSRNIRYLKQIKQRNTEVKYDYENVVECELKNPRNFLQFIFVGYGNENNHLKTKEIASRTERDEQMLQLRREGATFKVIAEEFGLSESGVRKVLKDKI